MTEVVDSSGFDFIFNERNLRKYYKRDRLEFLIETPTDPEDIWEVVCVEKRMETESDVEPLACQETFRELKPEIRYECMSNCKKAEDVFVFASPIDSDTDRHYFKETSSVCQSLTFSGFNIEQKFTISSSKVSYWRYHTKITSRHSEGWKLHSNSSK